MTKNETWNGERHFPIKGNYLEILDTAAAVDVVTFDKLGRVLNDERQVEAGFWIDRRGQEPFAMISITTGSSHAVKFGVSDGTVGNRSLPADITSDAARLLGIVYGNLGQLAQVAVGGVNALQVAQRGCAPGASFASITSLAANTAEEIVAPGSNTAGIIVWSGGFLSRTATVPPAAFLAKASAPATVIDGDIIIGGSAWGVAENACSGRRESPILVAAGKGVYFISTAAQAYASRYLNYTVLA